MRTVEDETGRRLLLLTESKDTSRVRDPTTGEERYVENDRLTVVEGVPPLAAAVDALPTPVRRVVSATRHDRALGLLLELDAHGPLAVRTMLERYSLCESDLHGLLAEFRAAELIEEATVGGERGYRTTAVATDGLERLREDAA